MNKNKIMGKLKIETRIIAHAKRNIKKLLLEKGKLTTKLNTVNKDLHKNTLLLQAYEEFKK